MAYHFSPLPRLPRPSSGSSRLSFSGRRLYFRPGSPSGSGICPEEPENERYKQREERVNKTVHAETHNRSHGISEEPTANTVTDVMS